MRERWRGKAPQHVDVAGEASRHTAVGLVTIAPTALHSLRGLMGFAAPALMLAGLIAACGYPATGRIAFVSERDERHGEIYVTTPNGAHVERLTDNLHIDAEPSWSPGGRGIAFRSSRDGNDDIYLMNADGSGVVRLTT